MPRLNSYQEVIEDYRWGARLKAMEELDYFSKLPSMAAAIDAVAEARKENGALFNHQRHLEPSTVEEVRRLLMAHRDSIALVANFDALFELLEQILLPVRGAKEMYIYDAALRLGAFLKKLPERIYLHKGTRVGAEALGIDVASRKWLEVGELPVVFGALAAHELEDVLCSYKEDLARIRRALGGKQRAR